MITNILILILIAILSAFVAGNNLSAAVGTIVGSRIVSKYFGLLLGAGGFSLGLIIEGRLLSDSMFRLMPDKANYVLIVLTVSLIMFMIAAYMRIPLSLIMAIVGTSMGIALRIHFAFDSYYLILVVSAWIIAPIISILFAYSLSKKLMNRTVKNTWKTAKLYKILLVVISFLTAFTLGANTFGLLASMGNNSNYTIPVLIAAIFVGSIFLSGGVIKRISQDIYSMRYQNALVSLLVSSILVESATFLSLPLPSTQTLTSSVFGTGLSYKTKAMMMKPFLIVVAMWIISPLLGLSLGYILA
jgi:PiT family inorganic phosphate transporter